MNYEKINKILYKYKGLGPLKVYMLDEIPKSKSDNAINSYGHGEREPIIVLGDDTAFGSASDGFFITQEKFYFKKMLESGDYFDIANIENIEKISEMFDKGFKFPDSTKKKRTISII